MTSDAESSVSYTLYLSSEDRVSGDNNNATFNINWASFLPNEYDKFKIRYSFLTSAGSYCDSVNSQFGCCYIVADFKGQSLSYNSSNNSTSLILGYSLREYPATYTCYNTTFLDYPPKTISKPNQNTLNIQIYNVNKQDNLSNQLLVDTNADGTILLTDMTKWVMVLEFIPIISSANVISSYHRK